MNILEEKTRRENLWAELNLINADTEYYSARSIRGLRIYGGYRGIWVDKNRTEQIAEFPGGLAISLKHSHGKYNDEINDDGATYKYPETGKEGYDNMEIRAVKNAMRAEMPIFFITEEDKNRNVRLARVIDANDNRKVFFVSFSNHDSPVNYTETCPLQLTTIRTRRNTTTTNRSQRFRYEVLSRYGSRCAMCDFEKEEVLEAVHIMPVKNGGPDDPRNGLVLCRNCHRFFDKGFVKINPDNFSLEGDLEGLRISKENLNHLCYMPDQGVLRQIY